MFINGYGHLRQVVLKLDVDRCFCVQWYWILLSWYDHTGSFLERKNLRLRGSVSVFEAETIRVGEALSWLMSRSRQKVIVETSHNAGSGSGSGSSSKVIMIDQEMVKFPCSLNCYNIFTSPPHLLMETDASI